MMYINSEGIKLLETPWFFCMEKNNIDIMRRLPYIFLIILVLVSILGYISVILYPTILVKLGITPQSEKYTELYFVNPRYLPLTVFSTTQIPFQFVIHNMNRQKMNYTYVVSSTAEKNSLDEKSIVLKSGEQRIINEIVVLPDVATRSAIVVQLQSSHESIRFWVNKGVNNEAY